MKCYIFKADLIEKDYENPLEIRYRVVKSSGWSIFRGNLFYMRC